LPGLKITNRPEYGSDIIKTATCIIPENILTAKKQMNGKFMIQKEF
jgi:hypothetical protein